MDNVEKVVVGLGKHAARIAVSATAGVLVLYGSYTALAFVALAPEAFQDLSAARVMDSIGQRALRPMELGWWLAVVALSVDAVLSHWGFWARRRAVAPGRAGMARPAGALIRAWASAREVGAVGYGLANEATVLLAWTLFLYGAFILTAATYGVSRFSAETIFQTVNMDGKLHLQAMAFGAVIGRTAYWTLKGQAPLTLPERWRGSQTAAVCPE